MAKLGRSKEETRRLKARLRGLLQDGKTEDECLIELDIRLDHLRWLKNQLIADELQEVVSDSPEEIWAKYRLLQLGCIRDLDEVIAEAKSGKIALNTAIGAVKAKSAIIENILVKGQDLGVIHKEADKREQLIGVAVASVTTEELREIATSKRTGLQLMKDKYLEADFSVVVDPDPVYQEDADAPEPEDPPIPKRQKVLEK